MRYLLVLLALCFATPLAAQNVAPALTDTLSAAQMRQRAGYADARAQNAIDELNVLRDHLLIMRQGTRPITATMTIPANGGWGYIEVSIPGQRMLRDSVQFNPPQDTVQQVGTLP